MAEPDVFIIESLDPNDEGNGRFEGGLISNFLRLHGKEPIYRYVRTKKGFKAALKEFRDSDYRYLHISAHGDETGVELTNQEEITYKDLSAMLKPFFKNRRLFLSACSMVHADFAKALIPSTKCYSLIGPTDDIHFKHAAVFWITAYHLVFEADAKKMTRETLVKHLGEAMKLFKLNIAYYGKTQGPVGVSGNLLGRKKLRLLRPNQR